MDIEYSTLCKVLEVGGFEQLVDARVTASFFMDEENLQVFQWMLTHWNSFGASPGQEAFNHEFPNISLIRTPEPLDYYLSELRAQRKYALLNEALDKIKDPLRQGDTDAAIKILNSDLEVIHGEVTELVDDTITETYEERMAEYDRPASGITGWPTGFPTMDLATSGLAPGQLVTIVGLQKRFKSMILMMVNIACHKKGAKTLYFSFEMSNKEQETRHDALRAGISLSHLQNKKHTPDERKKLIRMMHGLADMQPMTFVHDPAGATTVSAIASRINRYRPDVVFIDGTYMMDSEHPNQEPGSPQALTSITRSLKRLAQRCEVPIVQTTQALTWKAKRGLTLDSIGYSSSFAQDSDVIFGVEEIKDVEDREIMLRIIASRNCPRKDIRLAIDLDRGSILETDEVTFEPDDVTDVT